MFQFKFPFMHFWMTTRFSKEMSQTTIDTIKAIYVKDGYMVRDSPESKITQHANKNITFALSAYQR